MTMTELNEFMKTIDIEKAIKTREALNAGKTTLAKLDKEERENLEKAEMAVQAMQAQKANFDRSTEYIKKTNEDFKKDMKARKDEFSSNKTTGIIASTAVMVLEGVRAATTVTKEFCKGPTCKALTTSFDAGAAVGDAAAPLVWGAWDRLGKSDTPTGQNAGVVVSQDTVKGMPASPPPASGTSLPNTPKREVTMSAAPAPAKDKPAGVDISRDTAKGMPMSAASVPKPGRSRPVKSRKWPPSG